MSLGQIDPVYQLHLTQDAGKPGGGSWANSSDRRLKQNIQPTRSRATLVLRKAADHSVRFVRLRKL